MAAVLESRACSSSSLWHSVPQKCVAAQSPSPSLLPLQHRNSSLCSTSGRINNTTTCRPGSLCIPRNSLPARSRRKHVACPAQGAASLPAENCSSSPGHGNWQKTALLAGACVLAWGFGSRLAGSSSQFATISVAAAGLSRETVKGAVGSAWAGLAAGCLHTLAGPDHLAALTPLTIGRSHVRASLLGALWGFGHSTGQLILGLLMVVLKDRFDALVPALSRWGGTTVGVTLLAIGGLGLYECFAEEQRAPQPALAGADGTIHAPPVPDRQPKHGKTDRKGFGLATFATGIVYGLQPDALFVIIPALALPTKLAAAAYIVMFVAGTVAAMGGYTAVIGATSHAIKKSNTGLTNRLSAFASLVAIVVGLAVLLSGWGVSLPFGMSLS